MFKIRTANSKVAALLGALLAATALVALAPTAHAAVDQVCTVSHDTRFSPPITNNPQTVNITVNGNLFERASACLPWRVSGRRFPPKGLSTFVQ